jgi:iron complex outermembrane receptor protein
MTTRVLLHAVAVLALLSVLPTGLAQTPTKQPAASEEVVTLSTFKVVSEQSYEYQATNAQSATRLNVPLAEVPFNLQVITREFMEDTLAFGGQALAFGGGANREAVSWMGSVEGKSVRGFDTREFLRNGFLRYSDNGSATIERIEVIKGPTSILDGVTSPGGVINVITKKPNPSRDFVRLKTVYGAPLDRVVANLDINRRLLMRADGKPLLTFRLVGGYEESDYLSAHRHRELENLMPSILVEFSDRTLLGVQHEYYHVNGERGNEIRGFTSTARINDASGLHGDVPLTIAYGVDKYMSWDGPDYSTPEHVNDTLVSFQHSFSNDLVFNVDYNIHHRKVDWGPTTFSDGVVTVSGAPNWRRSWQTQKRTQEVNGIRANLAYKREIRKTTHRFVAGFLRQDDSTPSSVAEFADANGARIQEFFPLANPGPNLAAPAPAGFRLNPFNLNEILTTSFYLNHHAKWFDGKLVTLWGVYHAALETNSEQLARPSLTPTRAPITYDTQKTMPQVGVVYALLPRVGVYANYSQSMQGNAGRLDGFDNPFGPTPGEIRELGSKFNLLDGRLNGTVSLFEIVEKNRIVNDPEAPNKNNPTADPNFPRGANIAVGELTSKGFDADVYYNPAKNFSSVISYGYKTVEITNDPVAAIIGQVQNGYHHKVSLFNKYTWKEGRLRGLSANAGVIWRSKSQRTPDRFGAPAYEQAQWQLQAGLGYQLVVGPAKYRFGFAAKNLFQLAERSSGYIPGTRNPYYLANPAEYLFSLDVEF